MKVTAGSPKLYSKQINLSCIDSSGCNLKLTKTYTTNPAPPAWYVNISAGTAPYNTTWNILSGASSNPQVTFTSTGVKVTSSGPCTIEFTVTDDKGCTKKITVKF
mgnify:FL=1